MKNYYINPLSIWLSIQYSRYICRTNYTQMNYLETERLILRPFAEQDTESLFIILSDVEVNAFLPMFPLKDIEEAKTYLADCNQYSGEFSVEPIRNLLSLLGNPQDQLTFVHIAGTNGKGSVLAYVSTVLKEAGYKVTSIR